MTVLTEECVAPAWGPRVSDSLATARGFAVCTGPRWVLHTSLLSCLLFVGFLDPEKKLFSHRILSRDECIDPFSKTGNLRYVLATRASEPGRVRARVLPPSARRSSRSSPPLASLRVSGRQRTPGGCTELGAAGDEGDGVGGRAPAPSSTRRPLAGLQLEEACAWVWASRARGPPST